MDFRGRSLDLVGKQNLWFGISLALMLIGLIAWLVPPVGLNLGIDFKGGGQFSYRLPYSQRPQSGQDIKVIDDARTLLEKAGFQNPRLQIAGGDTLVVNTDARDEAELRSHEQKIESALSQRFAGTDANGKAQQISLVGQQRVGAVIGKELRNNAIIGVLLGVSLIALWIFIRYNFAGEGLRYAVAGIAALLHDVIVLLGLFALIGKIDPRVEVDGSFIAALLTVVGYSINDSVVIFDRVRENLRNRRKEPYLKVVNDSLLETMSRSINTGMTVLIMLFALLLFGGESIYNFVLAMLIGIASGLYSSIFNASMVLVAWHNWDEKRTATQRASRSTTLPRRTAATPVVGAPRSTPGTDATAASGISPAATTRLPGSGSVSGNAVSSSTSNTTSDAEASQSPRNRVEPPRKARSKRRY